MLAVALLTRSEAAVVALFVLGFLLSLFAVGIGDVRSATHHAAETEYETASRGTVIGFHTRLPVDGALFFYGGGLVVLGFAGMVLVGSYLR